MGAVSAGLVQLSAAVRPSAGVVARSAIGGGEVLAVLWWRVVSGLAVVVVCCFSAGVCGGEPCRVGMACCFLAGVCVGEPCCAAVACCFLPGFCSGEPRRADVACWGGWGPHTPCARQIGPHPPQPTPPSRHGSLRCVWVRRQQMRVAYCFSAASSCQPCFLLLRSCFTCLLRPRIPVQAHTGSHGQGVSRPTISARSVRRTAHPLYGRRVK